MGRYLSRGAQITFGGCVVPGASLPKSNHPPTQGPSLPCSLGTAKWSLCLVRLTLQPGRANWLSAPPHPKRKKAKQEREGEGGGRGGGKRNKWRGGEGRVGGEMTEKGQSRAVGVLAAWRSWQAFSLPFYIPYLVWRCSVFP